MNKKILTVMLVLLLVPGILAFGSNSLTLKQTYKDNKDVEVSIIKASEASSRYNLEFFEKNNRINTKGNLRVYGKDSENRPFSIEIKNIKTVNSISENRAGKYYKKGEAYTFVGHNGEARTFKNTLEDKDLDVFVKADAITYIDGKKNTWKGIILNLKYDGNLKVLSEYGEKVLRF